MSAALLATPGMWAMTSGLKIDSLMSRAISLAMEIAPAPVPFRRSRRFSADTLSERTLITTRLPFHLGAHRRRATSTASASQ
eukprot:3473750-Heterocapsa_arctica.AAC.1